MEIFVQKAGVVINIGFCHYLGPQLTKLTLQHSAICLVICISKVLKKTIGYAF